MSMAEVTTTMWAHIEGQQKLTSYLTRVLDTGASTHAYLLCGPDASDRDDIARRFSAALIADGSVETYQQILSGAHPDLHEYAPAGVGGYLVEQAREIVHDATLAPIRAPHKVYLVQQANKLSGAAANALLKTLEEPSADVVIVLLAPTPDTVLETLRSRCEVLQMNAYDVYVEGDAELFDLMERIAYGMDDVDLLHAAASFIQRGQAEIDELDERFNQMLLDQKDYLSASAKKQLEQQHKREVNGRKRARLLADIDMLANWTRDCLLVANGAANLRRFPEAYAQTSEVGERLEASQLLKAVDALSAARERITYNVTPQLAIEAMLLEVRGALCPR